jgi:hypothetical protein
MYYQVEQLSQTKNVLERLAKGVNPLTGKMVEQESFLQHVEIGKCLAVAGEIVERFIGNGCRVGGRNKQIPFIITVAQKKAVKLTDGKIGVNEFSRCVNRCLDADGKKLTGVELNKRLKKLGILSEEKLPDGKSHTTVNGKSSDYGFEREYRSYKGETYEMVVINEIGKKYLLDNLETIMATEVG